MLKKHYKILILILVVIAAAILLLFIFNNNIFTKPGITIAGPTDVKQGQKYKFNIKINTSNNYNKSDVMVIAPLSNASYHFSPDLKNHKSWNQDINLAFYFPPPIRKKLFAHQNYINVVLYSTENNKVTKVYEATHYINIKVNKAYNPQSTNPQSNQQLNNFQPIRSD